MFLLTLLGALLIYSGFKYDGKYTNIKDDFNAGCGTILLGAALIIVSIYMMSH